MNIHLLNPCKIFISSLSSKLCISDDRISRMYLFGVQPSLFSRIQGQIYMGRIQPETLCALLEEQCVVLDSY